MMYAFFENFVLPLSHNEVVHGKGSLLGRMPGDEWQKFANLRLLLGYMWAQAGKKLLFMGGEFGQRREWDHDGSLDWHLLDVHWHKGVQSFARDLQAAYGELPALWRRDFDPAGFEWVDLRDVEGGVVSFLRHGGPEDQPVLAVFNLTPVVREGYRVGCPGGGVWVERLNSDRAEYGGSGVGCGLPRPSDPIPWHGQPFSLPLTLPPLGALYLVPEGQPW